MAGYVVYTRPGRKLDDVILVRDGFAWGAFVFSVVWCLWHRMWLAAAAVLFVLGMIGLAARLWGLGETAESVATLAAGLILGFEASEIRRLSLLQRGYREAGVIAARSIDEAEIRYFASAQFGEPPAPQSAAKPPPQAPHDPLGLFGSA
jgi:hypothetical protein